MHLYKITSCASTPGPHHCCSLLSKVDQEIVKVVQERMRACQQREGSSYEQNCAEEMKQFNDVTKNYQSRCE